MKSVAHPEELESQAVSTSYEEVESQTEVVFKRRCDQKTLEVRQTFSAGSSRYRSIGFNIAYSAVQDVYINILSVCVVAIQQVYKLIDQFVAEARRATFEANAGLPQTVWAESGIPSSRLYGRPLKQNHPAVLS